MTDTKRPEPLVRAHAIRAAEESYSHPWNALSEIHGVPLAPLTGMKRIGVTLARIPPGKESFAYHSHQSEEEWIYVLSGRGVAEVDGTEHEVGPGDFMGFAAPSVAHHLRNPFEADLVYLMGGESRELEVADFPRLGRRMVRMGAQAAVYRIDAGKEFPEAP